MTLAGQEQETVNWETMRFEDFLSNSQQPGKLDSEGSFGISREKALQKVASLGLPFSYAWALKFVQAAVEAKTRKVEVKLTKEQINLEFPSKAHWDLSHLDQAFFLQEASRDLAHDHLIRALWSVHKSFRFRLNFGGQLLRWDGKKMTLVGDPDASKAILTLTVETGGSTVSFLRYFKTARVNAGVSKVLQDWAFAAPIPVKVDGRKINTLHACPTHREGMKKQVLAAVFLQSADPKLSLPWKADKWSPISRQIGVENVQNIGCCALLTIRSKYSAGEMRQFRWSGKPPGSLFYWVQSGVVIQSERLPSLGVGLSWAVLLSADGLETDLTSFSLQETEELAVRKKTVMVSLLDNLKSYRLRSGELFQSESEILEVNVTKQVKEQGKQWNTEFGLNFDVSSFRRPEFRSWVR